ncbi:MAG: mechanosensitive ion channel [Halobacteriales archaeon]|nr:mechanosensitive ion channel [Halobacteriales archaeon]
MPTVEELLVQVPRRWTFAAAIIVVGLVAGYLVNRINRRLLVRAGVPEAVEGTAFERTVRSVGSSTVAIIGELSMWFVVGVAVLAALSIANIRYLERFLAGMTGLLPKLFVAVIVLIVGVVVADKVALVISERLKGIKVPQVGIIPAVAKYTVVYIAVLIALAQVDVATSALLVLLGVYMFALVLLAGLALRDMLASAAAGFYLLLNQPYGIGDEIEIGEDAGIVQEISILVTRIEDNGTERVVPNRQVFRHGVVRHGTE